MDKEQIDLYIEQISDKWDPNDPCDMAKFNAMYALRDAILNYVPEDFSQLPKEAQDMFKEFAQYETEDNIRQAARHEFAKMTHNVTPDAEAGAWLMEDVFINLLRESKKEQ